MGRHGKVGPSGFKGDTVIQRCTLSGMDEVNLKHCTQSIDYVVLVLGSKGDMGEPGPSGPNGEPGEKQFHSVCQTWFRGTRSVRLVKVILPFQVCHASAHQ